jgi:hypothetical protein
MSMFPSKTFPGLAARRGDAARPSHALPLLARSCLLLACLLWWGAPRLAAQSLQLADGKVLLVSIEEPPTGEGLRVRRLDTGGVLDLRWEHLAPASVQAVKKQFDLGGDAQEELLERVEEVEYRLQGRKQVLVGKIVDRTEQEIVVQQKGVQYRIPKSDLGPIRMIEAPALQVYTKEEFYAARLAVAQPGTNADKHVLLAEDLIRFRDYERAGEHLDKAKNLGNTLDPQRLERMQAKLQLYKEAAKEREQLDLIIAARSRGLLPDFERGVKLIAQFEKDYAQGKLRAEFELEKRRFQDARMRYLAQQVADTFRRQVQYVADKKVAEDGLALAQAREYAENKMSDDLFARTAQQLRLELPEVKQLWSERAKYPNGKRTELFGYGTGSWVLGEAGVTKGTETNKQAGKADAKESGNERELERVGRALREAMERRRAANQGAGQGGGEAKRELTDQEWWAQCSRVERAGWLRAYYAEFGGQMVVSYASTEPCPSCYGVGTLAEPGPDGRPVRRNCFLCHNTKWLRRIKAY